MKIETVTLAAALSWAHAKNPKQHDITALADSFKRFGFVAPPLVDETTMVMVAGHGRCQALQLLHEYDPSRPPAGIDVNEAGDWLVPVVRGVSFKSDKERDAYVIADNQHTINGGWDLDKLTEMLGTLDDYEGIGFGDIELQAFGVGLTSGNDDARDAHPADVNVESNEPKRDAEKSPALAQDTIPDLPKSPSSKLGDVYKLGESLLIVGSCTDPKVEERIRAWAQGITRSVKHGIGVTSPPYNAGKNVERAVHGKAGGDSRYNEPDDLDDDAYADLLTRSTQMLLNVCDVALVNLQSLANNKRVIARWCASFANNLVDRAVWVKSTAQPAINPKVFNSKFEDIYIYSRDRKPKRTISTADFHGTVPNVVEGPTAARDNDYADQHGATMPVHLAQWMIEHLGARADYVVDPFGGTGTTLVVAHQLGKRAALVELDAAYADIIVARWEKISGESSLLVV